MYQYILNFEDVMIEEYLKKYTFLSKEEIENIMKEHNEAPHLRIAQKRLAEEVIKFIHSEDAYNKAVRITEALFKGNFNELSNEELVEAFKGNEVKQVVLNKNIVDILVDLNVASSKRQAREFVSGNSIEIKGEKVTNLDTKIDETYLTNNTYLIVKRGKKNYYIGKI